MVLCHLSRHLKKKRTCTHTLFTSALCFSNLLPRACRCQGLPRPGARADEDIGVRAGHFPRGSVCSKTRRSPARLDAAATGTEGLRSAAPRPAHQARDKRRCGRSPLLTTPIAPLAEEARLAGKGSAEHGAEGKATSLLIEPCYITDSSNFKMASRARILTEDMTPCQKF